MNKNKYYYSIFYLLNENKKKEGGGIIMKIKFMNDKNNYFDKITCSSETWIAQVLKKITKNPV